MRIVAVEDIPTPDKLVPVPLDRPMEVYAVGQQMADLCEQMNGIGLSAVQVGIPWNFYVVRTPVPITGIGPKPSGVEYYAECDYTPSPDGGQAISIEGCLSITHPDGRRPQYQLLRYKRVRVTGKRLVVADNVVVEDFAQDWDGLYGVVHQHEIDHAKGVLISQIGREVDIW
jgi:peptide deformylase